MKNVFLFGDSVDRLLIYFLPNLQKAPQSEAENAGVAFTLGDVSVLMWEGNVVFFLYSSIPNPFGVIVNGAVHQPRNA